MAHHFFAIRDACIIEKRGVKVSPPAWDMPREGQMQRRREELRAAPPHIVTWVRLRLGDEASHGDGAQMWKDTDGIMRDCQNRLFSLI